ncbi:hypothetical protein F5Y16DRAFT_423441 [Xylariaceae sp. FL0255]|nr:hypothetical protein F5Y16DRAFT_423441 [Xylariaceae sp. FL0255]
MSSRHLNLNISSNETATGEFIELPPTSQRYKTVRSIVESALLLLNRSHSKRCLARTAQEIILGHYSKNLKSLWQSQRRGQISFSDMPNFIDFFLATTRRNFPDIRLTHKLPGEAVSERFKWSDADSTVYDWNPREAVRLNISRKIINSMIATKNVTEYNVFMYQIIISVAHEILHFLTGAVNGGDYPKTPDTLIIGRGNGEAGFFWELHALGGITKFYAPFSRPRDTEQPGIPYIFRGIDLSDIGIPLSQRIVDNFVENLATVRLPLVQEADITQSTSAIARRNMRTITAIEMADLRSDGSIPEIPMSRSRYLPESRQSQPGPSYPQQSRHAARSSQHQPESSRKSHRYY